MPITVEWVEEPHILQITYQGKITLEGVAEAWKEVGRAFYKQQAHPFCTLSVILPDRELPVGLLTLIERPSTEFVKNIDAAAVTGVDHFLIGMMTEMLSRLDNAAPIKQMDSYAEALTYLQQFVRSVKDGI